MKGLFLVFHGFNPHSGISKKIQAQSKALQACGIDIELCYNRIEPDGTQQRIVGDQVTRTFRRGIRGKICKRICFYDLVRHIRQNHIEFIYIRHDINASPAAVFWLYMIRRSGTTVFLEIPTYPYDHEFKGATFAEKFKHRIDCLFRRLVASQIDRIVTFSDLPKIFGRPTICISNGIDFDTVPLKSQLNDTTDEVHLLAIANIHPWHGFDRMIEGLRRYYARPSIRLVRLRIVGDGLPRLIKSYRKLIETYGLERYCEVTGPHSGKQLDDDFEWCDLGVGSLARHRTGITKLKTLKNREYAARGVPFIYSELDSDFDAKLYTIKAYPRDAPIDISLMLDRFDQIDRTPETIRRSIDPELSWRNQMQRVVDTMKQIRNSKPNK